MTSMDHGCIVMRNPSRCVVLAFALLTILGAPAAAGTYFVDQQSATCSPSGPGTEAAPYCTIAAAVAAHHVAGDSIVVKPGTYREQISIPGSGMAGNPFVIRAKDPGVLIEGADAFGSAAQWTPSTGTVFVAPSVGWSPVQVFVDGARLTPSTSAPASLPVKAFTWVSGQGLFVNLGGDNPGVHATLVGRRSYGFTMFSKSWLVIDGFEIARTESRGIYIQNPCTDLVIARNRVSFAGSYGIQTVSGARIVFEENVVSDCSDHGIGLINGANACVLRYNESFRNIDPDARRANGIYMLGSPNNVLYGNRLHDNQDTGMQFNGGTNNCIAYNNRSWNNGDHGYDHLNAAGTIHVNDLAFGNFKDGFSIEGVSPNSRLTNCIAVENGLTSDEFDLWVNDSSSVGFVSDYNIFWNSTAQPPFKFITTKYTTLAGYQAASGQDAHSTQANPQFTNGPAGDFRLLAGSPAIDAANSGVPNWPATDAVGATRKDDLWTPNRGTGPIAYADIGPLEFLPPIDLPPVVTAPGTVQAGAGARVSFTVTASDPNGQPITSLIMLPLSPPAGSTPVFTVSADKKTGTFTWSGTTTPGNYKVSFIAANVQADTATTTIHVKRKSEPALATEVQATVLGFSNGFPNPSHDDVEFALDLPRDAQVRWAVFDLQGRMVWSQERTFAAGRTRLRWDGATTGQTRAATGVYLVRAWVEGTQFTRRVVRL